MGRANPTLIFVIEEKWMGLPELEKERAQGHTFLSVSEWAAMATRPVPDAFLLERATRFTLADWSAGYFEAVKGWARVKRRESKTATPAS